jgi:type I restriction enzyme S subunit
MSYENWIKKTLGELSQIRRGSSPRPIVKYISETGMPWVKIADATESDSRYIDKTKQSIKSEGVPRSVVVEPGELILSNSGTAGLPKIMGIKACIHDGWQVIRGLKNIDKYFLYYELLFIRSKLLHGAYDSSMKNLTLDMVRNFEIDLPSLEEQKAIVNILSSLDDKIELNNKINKNLEEIAQTLYKRWFVDFEFPNEEGEPYKSSGGEMIDSELGLIPKGWEVKEQGVFFPVVTGKKNANIAIENGKYKFFTCSQQIYLTDDYSFDGDAILVAGNGDFNVKYYSGKFEAYQRTYVLIPYNKKLSGFLFTAIKYNLNNITSGSRGSVISFITKGHIENYKMPLPATSKLEELSEIFKNILIQIANNNSQNEELSKTRDTLLPKLMNGEIEVPIEE